MPSAGPGAGVLAAWRAAADTFAEAVFVAPVAAAVLPPAALVPAAAGAVDGLLDRQLSVSEVIVFCDTCIALRMGCSLLPSADAGNARGRVSVS